VGASLGRAAFDRSGRGGDRPFGDDLVLEPEVEVLRVRAAQLQVLPEPEEGEKAAAVGRRAHPQHLPGAAQHQTQISRGLRLHLRDLGRQVAEVPEQGSGALGAITAVLRIDS
jgi:hypothetical protein